MRPAIEDSSITQHPTATVPFREALRVWIRVALQSFGGPAGQIAVMHRIIVDEKRWLSEERFLHALNYCMLLPGPEATQLATYIGWLLHGTRGGLVAGGLFVLPGFLSIWGLSVLYAGFHHVVWMQALFYGLKPAVLAVVLEALLRIGRRALKSRALVALAVAAFVAIFFFAVPFPAIVLAAALSGGALGRWAPRAFDAMKPRDAGEPGSAPADSKESAKRAEAFEGPADRGALAARPSLGRSLRVAAVWLSVWWLPLLLLAATLGRASVFVRLGTFFSQTAVVTFGGAYAVLAYIGQRAVETYHWLAPGEMLDGLGLAETTPGPLIQVVQFVGFLAAYRHPAPFSPFAAGFLGSLVVTWVTYVPCFLWIFLGAPYVERLRNIKALNHALSGITAAVVGVILNLAVWFSLHTLFGHLDEIHLGPLRLLAPAWATLDPIAFAIALLAALALFRWKLGMGWTLAGAAVLRVVVRLIAG